MLCNLCPIPFHHYGNKICFNQYDPAIIEKIIGLVLGPLTAFATGVASQQGTLTLPDTWFRPPFLDLLMLQLLRPNSSNLPCLYSTFHLEYPLVLSRFYLYRSFLQRCTLTNKAVGTF